ncbi:hypothetical protein D210916BOD24_03860 [Alteromonas sp. D210916BOD_24]|uniref:DUF192 domain-containing protein n=1 Tax=Alteromonas sp. D210916BOD_24 TaxID=3157618 RepID=UPI00399C6BF4
MEKSFFIVAALILTLGCAKAQDEPEALLNTVTFERVSLMIGGEHYEVEYASTYEQRARGLMFRKALCENCGMFFRFSSPKYAGMWMKNTFIPLDVAFIDRKGVITDIKPLTPHSLESVGSSKEVLYALEMNQGWFAENNIKVGDQITID